MQQAARARRQLRDWSVPGTGLENNRILASIQQPRAVDESLCLSHEQIRDPCLAGLEQRRIERELADEAHGRAQCPVEWPPGLADPDRLATEFGHWL